MTFCRTILGCLPPRFLAGDRSVWAFVVAAAAMTASAAPAATPANTPPAASESTAAQIEFFEAKVRPVLVEHCYQCHSVKSQKLKGSLYVDGRDGLLHGGDSGPAIVPGDADKSVLIEAIRYKNEDTAMPPKQKLPAPVIADLEAWVKMGAPWPNEAKLSVAKAGPDYAKLKAEHWAYQPIRKPAVPAVKDAAWTRGDLDRFTLSSMEAKGIRPVADADRLTLVRRVYFDLLGLPPTPEQIDRFLSDQSPNAFEKLVDELLASPHFGERWGRNWLDVARFAESLTLRGFVLKDAWKYRDYVIEQFNSDRPFDQFMQEQIAGDLIANDPKSTADLATRRRQMNGTTFLGAGQQQPRRAGQGRPADGRGGRAARHLR